MHRAAMATRTRCRRRHRHGSGVREWGAKHGRWHRPC
jgi:hypothetical protein